VTSSSHHKSFLTPQTTIYLRDYHMFTIFFNTCHIW